MVSRLQSFCVLPEAYAQGDPHNSCLKSLGETHQTEKYRNHRGFRPKTKKEKDFALKLLLMESALRPQLAQTTLGPKPSTSVWSTSASVREAVALAKD